MVRTAVRVARIGTMLLRTRITTLVRVSRVTILVMRYINATALYADLVRYGQPLLPA